MASPASEEMKSRARKLLALAGDPSAAPGEAENAREAAFRLMREAAITEADLSEGEVREFVIHTLRMPRVGRIWWASILNRLANLSGCVTYLIPRGRGAAMDAHVVGTSGSVQSVLSMWESVRAQAKGTSERYAAGYHSGIVEVIRKVVPDHSTHGSTALVSIAGEAKAWYESGRRVSRRKDYPRSGTDRESLRGYRDGGQVDLHGGKAIEGGGR